GSGHGRLDPFPCSRAAHPGGAVPFPVLAGHVPRGVRPRRGALALALAGPAPRTAGGAALSLPLLPPVRARREPLCRDPPRNAAARRMGGALPAERAVSRQAAAVLLAHRGQLLRFRHSRLGGPPGAGPGRSCLLAGGLLPWPAQRRRAGGPG